MAIRQIFMGKVPPESFRLQKKKGDWYIFTVSVPRDSAYGGFEKYLKDVGLSDKVVYKSPLCHNYMHTDRPSPSIYLVVCHND